VRKEFVFFLMIAFSLPFWGLSAEKPRSIYLGRPDSFKVVVFPGGFSATWKMELNRPICTCLLRITGGDIREVARDTVFNKNSYSLGRLPEGQYYLSATYPHGTTSADTTFFVQTTSMSEQLTLHGNYPNPFNPVTTISYTMPKAGKVTVEVFNTLGQKVVTLLDEEQSQGGHQVVWDANNAPSGVYYYRLWGDDFYVVKSMTLLR